MDLTILETSDGALRAGYTCPCGCTPSVAYALGSEAASDGCCCGNSFVVGPHAAAGLMPKEGFESEVQPFESPWGESLEAAWLIGPSTHADDHGHDHDHDHLHENHDDHHHDHETAATPAVGGAIDPVCGMTVEPESARAKDLYTSHAGVEYFFCGRGCKLDFADDPAKYLDPAYTPSM